MRKSLISIVSLTLLVAGCASPAPIPVAASCPAPRPTPQVLSESPSTGPTSIERYESTRQKLKNSLEKAQRP